MVIKKYNKKNFDAFILDLNEMKTWIKDAKNILDIEDIEKYALIAMPSMRTRIQEYMEEYPEDITEESAQKLHDFDMFIYKHIDLAYTAFSEFYWKRSEYNPPQSHWWWYLDDYLRGARDINPDNVWIKWEKIKAENGL